MKRSTVVRIGIFVATVFAAWAVLSLGSTAETPELEVGAVADQDYVADKTEIVIDEEETARLQQEARDAVPEPLQIDSEVESEVQGNVGAVFEDLTALAIGEPPSGAPEAAPELPDEEAEEGSTTTAEGEAAAEPALLEGTVFIDADGDTAFDPESGEEWSDVGLGAITVEITTHDGSDTVSTDEQGSWSFEYAGGPAVVEVMADDPEVPAGFLVDTENSAQLVECEPGSTCAVPSVGFGANLRDITEVVATISETHALPDEPVLYLANVAAQDVIRAALGEALHLPAIQTVALNEVTLELAPGIQPGEQLELAQANVRTNPPIVFISDVGLDEEASDAVGEIVATNLDANLLPNEELWREQQDAAAAEVDPVEREFLAEEKIVDQGDVLTALQIAAIQATSEPTIDDQSSLGLLAVISVLVSLLGLYLARFRPEFFARPRMVALLGIVIVLAAGSVRATVALQESFSWYVLPAVAFGFVTAVLFDQRIAVLVALAVGVITAIGTFDVNVTVYGALAALAPIPFVSSVSTRGAFRNAVVLSALVAAAVAGATSWFFLVGPNDLFTDVVPVAVIWAFGVSALASLLGLAALQFFESSFDVTTNLGLLDITDRNHAALQMLQEKAFGTFNHSLMVGTLADAAARSIKANALLARAMAYYHDLGKTENPTYFIENQFGMTNPHDFLDPKESAKLIRDHVTIGVTLARQYKIPTDVTEGIVSHHGDGVMRFFYEKARRMHGDDIDIDDFRHVGHKPRTAESAILMLADSLEAACRAEFQHADPSPDAIEKVVDRIMNEKLEDGQLSESPLTLGELTRIRQAFLESLIGHYHQRIAYPNFPGS